MHETTLDLAPDKEASLSAGKILYLTKDPTLLRAQMEGTQITNVLGEDLIDSISTDEILPNRAALSYSGREEGHLAKFALTGLRGAVVNPGDLVSGNFDTLVAGNSFARGSSRIHAPMALQEAGIRVVVAKAERIFAENCVNTGLYVVNPDSDSAKSLLDGKSIKVDAILSDFSPQSAEIMRSGGLLSYFRRLEEGRIEIPEYQTPDRPMTIAEKIITRKVLNRDRTVGKNAVRPGEEYIAVPDQYYGYELQSSAVIKALTKEFGDRIPARNPKKVSLDNDHTALLASETTKILREGQAEFARNLNITVYEADPKLGAPAICHTRMVEGHALPGQLILGNDSHTCTVGSVNTLAIGKGALDLAGAIAYDEMTISVPETIKINLKGQLPHGVTMKDFMLQFGARPELKIDRIGSGRVFEFGGDALETIPFDEQIKLTNMSIELLGFTGVIEPNQQIVNYLKEKRGMSEEEIRNLMVKSDEGAQYSHTFDIDLSSIEPTVATPGDTQNGRPLSEIEKQNIKVDKVYIGSCTHGTPEDLRQAAEILRGRKVADGVKLYVQASSRANLDSAESAGYIKDCVDAGAELLPIGCGACMNAGPGSTETGEVGLFATNRNFPGRTGKGETYLSSVYVAAASAVEGRIIGPDNLTPAPEYKQFEGINIQWNKIPWKFNHPELGKISIDTYSIWNPQHHAEIAQRLAKGERCALYMMGTFGVGQLFSGSNSEDHELLDSVKQRDRAQNLVVFSDPIDIAQFIDLDRLPDSHKELLADGKRHTIYPGPMHAVFPAKPDQIPSPDLIREADKSTAFFWMPGHWGYESLITEMKKKVKGGLFGGGSLNIHGQEPSFTTSDLRDREMVNHPEWLTNIDFVILDEISEAEDIGRSHTQVSFLHEPPLVIRKGSMSPGRISSKAGYELQDDETRKPASSKTPYDSEHDAESDNKIEQALERMSRFKTHLSDLT